VTRTLCTGRINTHKWPRRLIIARAVADVVRITVRVAIVNQEAMREARKPLRHAVDVAADTLLEIERGGLAAADCGRAGCGVEQWSIADVAGFAADVPVVVPGAGHVAVGGVPALVGLD